MFYRVQPHRIKKYLLVVPQSPFVEFRTYKRIVVVDVIMHQKIVVPFFRTDHFFKIVLMVVDNSIDACIVPFRKIYRGEAVEVPFKIRVLVLSARECKFCETLDVKSF